MRTPIRSSCLTRSEIVCREWLAVKDLLSGSGGLGNAAARTCFGVGRRFKSNDANHDYDGNDNRNNAASAPFSIVRVIWVRDAAIVLLVRHGLIPFLDIPPSKRTVVASCIRQSRQPVGSFPQALLAKTCRQSKEETPDHGSNMSDLLHLTTSFAFACIAVVLFLLLQRSLDRASAGRTRRGRHPRFWAEHRDRPGLSYCNIGICRIFRWSTVTFTC